MRVGCLQLESVRVSYVWSNATDAGVRMRLTLGGPDRCYVGNLEVIVDVSCIR
jgi:hypothetical protein